VKQIGDGTIGEAHEIVGGWLEPESGQIGAGHENDHKWYLERVTSAGDRV
jgi:hypothetical protein